jgi:hypothetical protein
MLVADLVKGAATLSGKPSEAGGSHHFYGIMRPVEG